MFLARREHNIISEEMVPYFHDIYDHLLRVSESTDTLRELVSTIVDTNISLRDYRQNQIMKKVTSWAAIWPCRRSLLDTTDECALPSIRQPFRRLRFCGSHRFNIGCAFLDVSTQRLAVNKRTFL